MTYSFWDSKRSLQLFKTHLQRLKRTYTCIVLETFLLSNVGHDKGALTLVLKHIYKVKSDLYLYSIKNFFPLHRTSSNQFHRVKQALRPPRSTQYIVLIIFNEIKSNKPLHQGRESILILFIIICIQSYGYCLVWDLKSQKSSYDSKIHF